MAYSTSVWQTAADAGYVSAQLLVSILVRFEPQAVIRVATQDFNSR